MTPAQRLRQIANVLNLSTPLGLAVAVTSRSKLSRGPRGLLIASGYQWRLPLAGAFTVGNVVVYRAPYGVAGTNPVLLGHEERHSTQYAYCLGLPFLVLYGAAACWSMVRTGNPGLGNWFERQAGLEAGGYIEPTNRRQDHPAHDRIEA
ncbi:MULTISPECIES: hypothetical protein [Paenarthrobacter]|jgi:hypothetical protein|uniref:DUF4157 domain-containing protein n=1 Tax=Paenarthrobacter nicotinovorans TaxID=29320 RepID=A0ABT9TQC1_PAENI|nr:MULTISPECIES: hypothetical protein [Paenarthrobacter]KQQ97871.1 hypothetical protein ASF74_16095 [Arthrobacter sp. Leaf145]SKB88475.1 hypothetical protein SAMN05660916_03143 [Arthrobacter sp. 31Cvi3.1E]BCW10274.1 hypothetical protein NtRootA2_15560 [Arthrobacter sp. NtRootA2]BCW14354.1 hypothetical protein NtRootA4_13330 [Arthrobacter sp. NtRootA4]BCW22689.1 hypothetical protein NtRootC7_15560 [Arthrobacter sp. NtRootC7]BCW26958.1 hypothetical protein NtRootC45_15580 [Arthrobacter sp. NtRo